MSNDVLIESYLYGKESRRGGKLSSNTTKVYSSWIKKALAAVDNKPADGLTEEDRRRAMDALSGKEKGCFASFLEWCDPATKDNDLLIKKYVKSEEFYGRKDPECCHRCETEIKNGLRAVGSKQVADFTEEDRRKAIDVADKSHAGGRLRKFFKWYDELSAKRNSEPVSQEVLTQEIDQDLELSYSNEVFDVPSSVFPLLDGVVCIDSVTHYKRAIVDDTRSETEHQISVMGWTRRPDVQARYPDLAYIYHIPNEISGSDKMVHDDLEQIRKERYQMGVQAGIPDLCLPVARGRYHALYIEMKSLKQSATLSEKQLYWQQRLRSCGNAAEICYGDVDAINLIINYLELSDGDSL